MTHRCGWCYRFLAERDKLGCRGALRVARRCQILGSILPSPWGQSSGVRPCFLPQDPSATWVCDTPDACTNLRCSRSAEAEHAGHGPWLCRFGMLCLPLPPPVGMAMHACFRPAGDGRRLTATPVIGLEKMVRLPVLIVECRSSPTQTQVLSFGRPVLHSSVMCRQCSFSLVGCTPG